MRSARKPWSQIGAVCAVLTLAPMFSSWAALAQEAPTDVAPAEASTQADRPPPHAAAPPPPNNFRGGRGRGEERPDNAGQNQQREDGGQQNNRRRGGDQQQSNPTPLIPDPQVTPTPETEGRRGGGTNGTNGRNGNRGDGNRGDGNRGDGNQGRPANPTPNVDNTPPNTNNGQDNNRNGNRGGSRTDNNDRNGNDRNQNNGNTNRRDDNARGGNWRDGNGRGPNVIDRNDRNRGDGNRNWNGRDRNDRNWNDRNWNDRDRIRRSRGPDYRWRGAPPRIIIQRYYSLPPSYYDLRPIWAGPLYDEDIWDSFEPAVYDALPFTAREKHEQAFQVALYGSVGRTQSWWHGSVRGDVTIIDERYFGDEWCRDFVQTIRAPDWTRTVDGRMCIDRGEPWRLVSY